MKQEATKPNNIYYWDETVPQQDKPSLIDSYSCSYDNKEYTFLQNLTSLESLLHLLHHITTWNFIGDWGHPPLKHNYPRLSNGNIAFDFSPRPGGHVGWVRIDDEWYDTIVISKTKTYVPRDAPVIQKYPHMSTETTRKAYNDLYFWNTDTNVWDAVKYDCKDVMIPFYLDKFIIDADNANLESALLRLDRYTFWTYVDTLDSPPQGSYSTGEIVFNKTPKIGSHMGWIYIQDPISTSNSGWYGFGIISQAKSATVTRITTSPPHYIPNRRGCGDLYVWDSQNSKFVPCQVDAMNIHAHLETAQYLSHVDNVQDCIESILFKTLFQFKGVVDTPPTIIDQTYNNGDFIFYKTPKSGGHIGWVLIDDGWYPWGVISTTPYVRPIT